MGALTTFVTELLSGAGHLGGEGLGLLSDRLELASLELREAKIRLIQAIVLACAGTALCLLGVVLLIIAVALALPPEWRLYWLFATTGISLVAGLGALFSLRRRLSRRPLAFSQSLAELDKDKACF
jgi:uncharacterized membrane protein YqjE